jgi:hypothetical protein
MKQILANYFLKIYLRFIVDEDKDIYKNWAKPFIKGTMFVHNIYIWIASIIFFPFFIFYMRFEKEYKNFEKEHQKIIKYIQ